MSALLLGTVANGSPQADEGGLGCFRASFGDGVINCIQITGGMLRYSVDTAQTVILPVAVVHVQNLPSVSQITLFNVFGEGYRSVSIDRDV